MRQVHVGGCNTETACATTHIIQRNLVAYSYCKLMFKQGAARGVLDQYATMAKSDEMQNPLSWSASDFSLDPFDLVLLPGGHEKSVRQIIDSPKVHQLMAEFFPKTKKPSKKAVAAVCHGVMVLSESKDSNGDSVIKECVTTALPAGFERVAFWGTRAFLGDYYKTYGAGSEHVEQSVSIMIGTVWSLTD